MNNDIKVGDLVETCSLMAGVVMKIDGDVIHVRLLDVSNYHEDDYAHCSLKHCGIVKLTAKQALYRLMLGRKRLEEIWDGMDNCEDDDIGREYDRRVAFAAIALNV